MSFSEYIKKIDASSPQKVYWVFGKEKKLMDELVEKLSKKISPQEKHILFGGEMEIDSLVRSLFETDLFAKDKLNIIRDCNEITWTKQAEKSFIRWLENPSGQDSLIFMGNGKSDFPASIKKQITKVAGMFELKPLYENEIRDYLKDLAAKNQKSISPNTIQLIIELCGTDLQEIHSQWDKLLLYLGEKTEIKSEDVEEVINLTSHFNVFQLIDNMMAGNYIKALKIIHSLLEAGIHPLQPMALIIRHFSQLEQLLLAGDDPSRMQELRTVLKIWDFQYKKIQSQMRWLTLDKVETIISVLGEIDTELKSRASSNKHSGIIFEKGMLKIFTLLKKKR